MALRLHARLKRPPAGDDLVDIAVPPVKGHVEERAVKSNEVYTPAGLPLRFYAHFRGDWGEVMVMSVDAVLLHLSVYVNSYADVRLPTDEVMAVSIVNY